MSSGQERGPGWSGVARWLFRPSWSTLIGALLVAVAQLAAIAHYLTPQRLAQMDPLVWANTESDLFTVASLRFLKLRVEDDPRPTVTLFLSSTLRSALVDHRTVLDEVVTRERLPLRTATILSSGFQLVEVKGLLDNLPPHYRGLIVIEVFPEWVTKRTGRKPPRPSLFTPPVVGNFFLDHLPFFTSRVMALMHLGQPIPLNAQEYVARETTPVGIANFKRMLIKQRPDLNLGELPTLKKILDDHAAPGRIQFALVETPRHPKLSRGPADDAALAAYTAAMRELGQRPGVSYWELGTELTFEPNDFYDFNHLFEAPARQRFQQAFEARLAEALRQFVGAGS